MIVLKEIRFLLWMVESFACYFIQTIFMGLRYEGPKKAFQYLKIHDTEILLLFDEALSNTSNFDALEKLIKKLLRKFYCQFGLDMR
jgi:hypothetical protein